jgi:hypothetical protein
MKRCSSCKTFKPMAEFYRNRSMPDGCAHRCIPCDLEALRQYKNRKRGGPPRYFSACRTDAERREWFEEKYTPEPNTGCWIWLQRMDKMGYGVAFFGPNRGGQLAHRVAYELLVGPIPEGKYLCHKCDTPLCINPQHMFIGDDSSNLRDCVRKERCGTAKITNAKAVEIRQLKRTGEYTNKQLGEMFGIGVTAVRSVVNRRSWVDAEQVVDSTYLAGCNHTEGT